MKVVFNEWKAFDLIDEVESTTALVGEEYALYSRALFNSVSWPWPSDTLRFRSANMGGRSDKPFSDGVWVGAGDRDIVDTGRLRDSMTGPTVKPNRGGLLMDITWKAPYAMNVIKGGPYGEYVDPRGNPVGPIQGRPGRDWISVALADFPAKQVFVSVWQLARA